MRRPVVAEIGKTLKAKENHEVDDPIIMRAFGGYQSILIIRCALIEGSVFFNLMIWFLEGSIVSVS